MTATHRYSIARALRLQVGDAAVTVGIVRNVAGWTKVSQDGAQRRWSALLVALMLCGAAAEAPTAASAKGVPSESPFAVTLPNHWISGWGHGTAECHAFTSLPWAMWKTYGEARVGDRWVLQTSSRSMCSNARKQASSIIKRQGLHLGATLDRSREELYAAATHLFGGTPANLPASLNPRGYKCFILPPSLEVGFEQELKLFNNSETAWTQAVGASASFAICLTSPHLHGHKFTAASYFAFGPQVSDCAITYVIKQDRPDPEEPGHTIAPPVSEAQLPADYSEHSCAPIAGAP